jgi:7-cyano-7-deazaguanine synthase
VDKVAVLASGGLDSCVLLSDMAQETVTYPLYIRNGLAWEEKEIRALGAFITALNNANVQEVAVLPLPLDKLYGEHWSMTGKGVPGAGTEDAAMFLPGRNVLLIVAAAVWCSTHGVERIALGSLGGNPFPDATPEFFVEFARLLTTSLAHHIEIAAPYRNLHKRELIRTHQELPLELTLTCIAPRDDLHCGQCNKCDERQAAFVQAGVRDKTRYAA